MHKGHEHIPDKDALIQFANSDAGKAFIGKLSQSDPEMIRSAVGMASSGDMAGAMKLLQSLLSAEDSGRRDGYHGK